jgi:UDP-glucuronate 4-epimerase
MKVLVTGAAGFIGHHVSLRLAQTQKCDVLGIDNLNDYYPVALKRARLAQLEPLEKFRFVQSDFSDAAAFGGLYENFRPDYVVHLGAQAGVRYSLENPAAYVQANVSGFLNVLEACRARPPKHMVFASSSSVYGASARVPFSEEQKTDEPLSFYGATKKSSELMAYSYAHLHGLRLTGLRFFTVYGPWGRPDMVPTLFSRAICEGSPLRLFNHGRSLRDFTHIDDIVDGIVKLLLYPAGEGPTPAYRVFNLGHNRPVEVRLFVEMLESLLGQKARIESLPAQPGDMPETCASLAHVHAAIGYTPKVSLEDGLRGFTAWFKEHYGF